jgi:hypothetical protein
MDRTIILLAIFVLLGGSAFAQQDSLIVGNVYVDSGTTSAYVPVYGVVFDSIYSYSLTLGIRTSGDTFGHISDVTYFPPLTNWDILYDTLLTDPSRITLMGWAPDHNPIYTQGRRLWLWVFRVALENDLSPQVAMIDTFGAFSFGSNSAFVPGYIYIGNPQRNETEISRPSSFSLSQNYPNPFNSSTEIQFSISQSGPASLVIYDIQGREIRRLLGGDLEPGSHSVIWNGLNDDSKPVSSGIYFYRLISGDATQTNRMTLLR